MDTKQSSAIFGLNFLQDMGSQVDEIITGAYDPEQGLWVSDGETPAAASGSSSSGTNRGSSSSSNSGLGKTMGMSSSKTASTCWKSRNSYSGVDQQTVGDLSIGNDTVKDVGVDFD